MVGNLADLIGIISAFLGGLGLKDETIQLIVSLTALFAIATLIARQSWLILRFLIEKWQQRLLVNDLHPFYTRQEVEDATKYYIPTQFQNVPPSEDDEPGRSHIAAARQPLIPLFLKKAFKHSGDDNKYYLVLADSGMGKTTFMINLYLRYKLKREWFWERKKYNIKLYPLGHPDTLNRIRAMPNDEKENCILLLDAFDEDNQAILDYEKRLGEVLGLVWNFREVVITCRTQFFPSSEEEPKETGKYTYGGYGKQYRFQKVYVSVFSDKDVKRYLRRKYTKFLLFKGKAYKKAKAVVEKSPNLVMRPMLLKHIDEIIEADMEMNYSFQVYEAMIEGWTKREANKAGIQEKYGKNYAKTLHDFSRALAREIYLNRDSRGGKLSIKVDESTGKYGGVQLKDVSGNNINIDKVDQSSRSLLNRNAVGEYKFSHKSIFEYFLAYEVMLNSRFRDKFFFDQDLDSCKEFFLYMLKMVFDDKRDIYDIVYPKLGLTYKEVLNAIGSSFFEKRRNTKEEQLFYVAIVKGGFLQMKKEKLIFIIYVLSDLNGYILGVLPDKKELIDDLFLKKYFSTSEEIHENHFERIIPVVPELIHELTYEDLDSLSCFFENGEVTYCGNEKFAYERSLVVRDMHINHLRACLTNYLLFQEFEDNVGIFVSKNGF